MTREEQIAIASCAYGSRGSSIDFSVGAKWADSNPKSPWISVEDDLPCNHEEMVQTDFTDRVLVLTSNGCPEVEVTNMCVIEGKWEWNTLTTVLYWMPIPKLPKE